MSYLMLTSLLVFAGVWIYMWSLDLKIKRLRVEMREDEAEKEDS